MISSVTPARAAATACIVILSGCGGASPASSLPQSAWRSFSTQRISAAHRAGWMAPGTAGETLLYVSDAEAASVYVYSYPQAKLVGTLTKASRAGRRVYRQGGRRVDHNSESLQLSEYAHGGTTPIATLGPNLDFAPLGCAVNPVTGDLAVAKCLRRARLLREWEPRNISEGAGDADELPRPCDRAVLLLRL